MGANAQTTVQKFVDGAVLTAPQQNFSAATGVPVFATTVTRDAAFGGANKVLAEGQTCYLEDANVVQYYDGAAWATVGPAAASGFTFITGASFTGQTTVTFANSVFTSGYQFYKVILFATAVGSPSDLSLQFRDNGGTKSTANYYAALTGLIYTGGAANVLSSGTTSAGVGSCGGSGGGLFEFMIGNPTDAGLRTTFTTASFGNDRGRSGGGMYVANEAHTGLVFTGTQSFTGNYKVYGLANS